MRSLACALALSLASYQVAATARVPQSGPPIPVQCNTRNGMSQTECTALANKWASHQCAPKVDSQVPANPIRWIPKQAGCVQGSSGCKTFCDCPAITCKNACQANGCNWEINFCAIQPQYMNTCYGRSLRPSASPTSSPSQSECFPGSAGFVKEDGSYGRMEDIRVGDRVPVVNVLGYGELGYAPVLSFQHVERKGNYSFVRLEHEGGDVVEASSMHRVFVSDTPLDAPRDVEMRQVREGQWLWHKKPLGSGLEPAKVSKVAEVVRRGIFSFFVDTGAMLVEKGTLVSVYTYPSYLDFDHNRFTRVAVWSDYIFRALGVHTPFAFGELPEKVDSRYTAESVESTSSQVLRSIFVPMFKFVFDVVDGSKAT